VAGAGSRQQAARSSSHPPRLLAQPPAVICPSVQAARDSRKTGGDDTSDSTNFDSPTFRSISYTSSSPSSPSSAPAGRAPHSEQQRRVQVPTTACGCGHAIPVPCCLLGKARQTILCGAAAQTRMICSGALTHALHQLAVVVGGEDDVELILARGDGFHLHPPHAAAMHPLACTHTACQLAVYGRQHMTSDHSAIAPSCLQGACR